MSAFERGTVSGIRIVRVIDGDTVWVRQSGLWRWFFPGRNYSVRLYGIDAPESNQKYGDAATRGLRQLLRGGGYRMESMGTDRYDRVVGLIYRKSREQSVNHAMVRQGWAHAYVRYGGKELDMPEAEREARRERRGIWKSGREPELPERWRQRQREGQARRSWVKVRMALTLAALAAVALIGYCYVF